VGALGSMPGSMTVRKLDSLPPSLMTSERGSFAERTILVRKPQIIARVLADHRYPPQIVEGLEALRAEITGLKKLEPVREATGDTAFWNSHWAKYQGRTWLELPWYFAETYFYRRLLEAVRYFQPGPWRGRDPFGPQKRAQEASARAQIGQVLALLGAETDPEIRGMALLHGALWGNRADLSNFTVREGHTPDVTLEQPHILIDHTAQVMETLHEGLRHIAFINDNVGADSLYDLALADHFLRHGWARRITFHLKNQPFFVSDAMPQDIRYMIAGLQRAESAIVASLGHRLNEALVSGRLTLTTHPFWTRCLGFRDMPRELHRQLEQADLIILKGDVNYRRLLDDRHWPPTTDLGAVTRYFPRPYVVLRTLKGEIVVGLSAGEAERLALEDPHWLINGKRGLIHMVA